MFLARQKISCYYLTGMCDENTVELIFTADGSTQPLILGASLTNSSINTIFWKFTSLKPAMNIENVLIEMSGLKFDSENLFFYSNELPDYPDEIDFYYTY